VDITHKIVDEAQNTSNDPDTVGKCSEDFEVHDNWNSSSLAKRWGDGGEEREREML
jgi:hypothetical protein